MITGIGLDIVELSRIRRLDEKSLKFRTRVLTQYEQSEYNKLTKVRKVEFLAGRFTAKEAFSKALGTGIGGACSFQDIEIRKDSKGKPSVFLRNVETGLVSITHSRDFAAAQVLIQTT